MKINSKESVLLLGIITLIVIGVLGTTIYFLTKKTPSVSETPKQETPKQPITSQEPQEVTSTQPEESTSTVEIDTSDWKTYRNEEYNYQINYPSDWEVKDRSRSHPCTSMISIENPRSSVDNWVRIAVCDNPDRLSIRDWLNLEAIEKHGELFFIKEIKIGEEKGIRVSYLPLTEQAHKQDITYLSKDNFIYLLSLRGNDSDILTKIFYSFRLLRNKN